MTRRAALALALLATARSANAEERPLLVPTRDAVVEYRVTGGRDRPPLPVHVHFSGGKLRAEADGLPGYVILDRGADRATVVMDQQRAYFELPARTGLVAQFLPGDGDAYRRTGETTVGSLRCTTWDVRSTDGRSATGCVTADGVVLKGEGRDPRYGNGSAEAVSVSFAPQPARLFQPPPGYQRIALPVLPGPGRPPG